MKGPADTLLMDLTRDQTKEMRKRYSRMPFITPFLIPLLQGLSEMVLLLGIGVLLILLWRCHRRKPSISRVSPFSQPGQYQMPEGEELTQILPAEVLEQIEHLP